MSLVMLDQTAQAHTHTVRNDAPVGLELPPDRRLLDEKPPARKPPLKRETTIDDTQIFSWNTDPQAPIDNLTQAACNHSRGLGESNTVLFTDLHKPPLESPDGGEKTRGCTVSPTPLQSQVDPAVEPGNGTEVQVDKKVETTEVKRLVRDDSVAPNEKMVDMETESVASQNVQPSKDKTVEISESTPKTAEVSSPETQKVKRVKSEPSLPHLSDIFEHPQKMEINIDFKEIPMPVSKVISVAELLRAQLKALDSTLINSAPTVTMQADLVHKPTATMAETRQQLKEDERKSNADTRKSTETATDDTNIKATLMQIYHELNKDSGTEHILTQDAASPHLQAVQKPLPTPPVSGEATGLCGSAKNYVVTESEASTQAPQTDYSVVSHNELKNVEPKVQPLASTEEHIQRSETPTKTSNQTPDIDIKAIQRQSVQRLSPELKLNSKNESEVSETNSTNPLDPCRIEDLHVSSSQMFPTKSAKERNGPPKPDSSVADEISVNQTPKFSPLLKNRNCVSPIPSATVQELASGARPKILIPKTKVQESTEATSPAENPAQNGKLSISPAGCSTSPSLSRRSPLLQPPDELTSPVERRSPLISRRKTLLETPNQQPVEETQTPKTKDKPAESKKYDPFKAPQVIRKIRSETFADASGHLKLWCQFFNVLSDSTITWYKNEEEIARLKKNAGDETQVNLAIVQTSRKDSGVYRCSITNDHGTDSTDLLLSADILTGMSLCEDLGVGEEIEMTPLIFSKAVADSGIWGNRLFGRIMMQESQIGDGCSQKVWRAKVIYGLEPVFESGHTCIVKVPNPITYGGKQESCLTDRNLEIVKQGCKIQNLAREYCKIFSAEARLLENFGPCLEVIPVYLMYRPANPVPYAMVETDMAGVYQKYSSLDPTGRMDTRTSSWVEQKCCALQHWIHQWTNGNLLFTRLEGVDTKITNVGVSVKSSGHLGLSVEGNPTVFEQFVSQHQCNYFCGLLGLRSLKVMDSLLTPSRPKSSRSPLLQRKMAAGSSSPQTGRKAGASPRISRKAEQEGGKTPTKAKAVDAPKNL